MVAYLDAAQDRQSDRSAADFDSMVEAVRVGYIFARDQKQYNRWRGSRKRRRQRGLTGAALESAVMGLARTHPEYVVVE